MVQTAAPPGPPGHPQVLQPSLYPYRQVLQLTTPFSIFLWHRAFFFFLQAWSVQEVFGRPPLAPDLLQVQSLHPSKYPPGQFLQFTGSWRGFSLRHRGFFFCLQAFLVQVARNRPRRRLQVQTLQPSK